LIYIDLEAIHLQDNVARLFFLIKIQPVGKARATTTGNGHSKSTTGDPFFLKKSLNLLNGAFS